MSSPKPQDNSLTVTVASDVAELLWVVEELYWNIEGL